MSPNEPPAPANGYNGALWRLLNRASVAFLLDMISIARGDRHPLDALLLSVIVQANTTPVMGNAELQVRYAAAETPPPDEIRRPISINALATSLRLPFETVRRRVHRLSKDNLCRMERAGVVVPTAVLTSPEYLTGAFTAYERLRTFYTQVRHIGGLTQLPHPTVALAGGMVPMRAVARTASEYILRAADLAQAQFGDLVSCLLLLEVLRSNTEHLGLSPEPAEMLNSQGFVLDEHRRPVRVIALARRTGISAETTRRHLAAMVERDWLEQGPNGFIAPARVLARPRVVRFGVENQMHLRRMFSALAQLGVLAVWMDLDVHETPPRANWASAKSAN